MAGRTVLGLRRETIAPWLIPVGLVIAWEVAARTGLIAARVLPAPSAIFTAFLVTLQDGSLLHHAAISAWRALQGLIIGGVIGFVLGVVNGLWKRQSCCSTRPCRCYATCRISPSSLWSSCGSASTRKRRSSSSPSA